MSVGLVEIGCALGLYVVAVVVVGLWSSRRSTRSAEEYFVAGRGLGSVVLFMALFGTNTTPFLLVGIPGRAYHDGVATFGLNAPLVALGVPLTFWLIGPPARRLAQSLGAMTPAELYARRLQSKGVGWLLFALFTLYTVPYMVTGVIGAARSLAAVTEGGIPTWLGGLGVTLLALFYTTLGGMRATAWTNVLQGTLFFVFLLVAAIWILFSLGGPGAVFQEIQAEMPELLLRPARGLYTPQAWTSWGLAIALTVIAFPHMLVRLIAADSDRALRQVTRAYPWALLLLWVPAVLIGVMGALAIPGLEGRASDRIFSLMTGTYLPPALAAFAFVAVLAAVMSTLDAQILTLGSMLTRDVLGMRDKENEKRGIRVAQAFGFVVAAATYGLAQVWGDSVFDIAKVAFSGYVTLFPTLLLGVRWSRFTSEGAMASIVAANGVLCWGLWGGMPTFGFLPVFWALWVGFIAAYVGTRIGEWRRLSA